LRSVESGLLRHANQLLDEAVLALLPDSDPTHARLSVLEVVAGEYAGWPVEDYWRMSSFDVEFPLTSIPADWAHRVLSAIMATEIPVPLALSALSREVLLPSQQRTTGAYYTDWRLAQLLAGQGVAAVSQPGIWVDPACGTGILLVAAALCVAAGPDRDSVIQTQLTGADLSARALRGALLSVASLTKDLAVVSSFASRLLLQDSLQSRSEWLRLAPNGVAMTIANPPWERLRVSRHEFAQSDGEERHYGQAFASEVDLTSARREILQYVAAVAMGTRLQGSGDYDLYKLFLELSMGLAAEGGVLAMLVPAGLIRAQGTESLREELNEVASTLSISVIENRARHFAIDSRFKFVAVVARIGQGEKEPIQLSVADRLGVLPKNAVTIDRGKLLEVRPDRSLPEVRSTEEWDLFSRLTRSAKTVGDASGPWHPTYRREVDMTSDQDKFKRRSGVGTLPLLEGRHVHQFRWRAKTYISGQGRAAIWNAEPLATARVRTQWHIPRSAVRSDIAERLERSRIGFCDITGQTNERSLLVARVPANFVCGNKVPTLTFDDGGKDREDLFVALANSFAVDWMLRRVVTTSVNFFLLNSLPLPLVDEQGQLGRELIHLARRISDSEGDTQSSVRQVGQWRTRLDALAAAAWGLGLADLETVMSDFPLLDRGQPSLPGERGSTITRDSVIAALANHIGVPHPSINRAAAAVRQGAIPYIGAEYV
jgi:hypothetical protein